jgi:hypothetical protein
MKDNCVYIARCCAPFTLAHKREVSTVSCGPEETKNQTRKKEHIEAMATKKGGKKAAKKGGAKKAAKKGGTKKAAKKR